MDLPPVQERIVDAYVRLAQSTSSQAITVTRLCAEAGVSRSTFYVQFEGLESVPSLIVYGTLQDIRRTFRNCEFIDLARAMRTNRPIPMLQQEFEYISKERERFAWLIGTNGPEEFHKSHFKLFRDALTGAVEGMLPADDLELVITLSYGAFERLTREWLASGCANSPEHEAWVATRTLKALVSEFTAN